MKIVFIGIQGSGKGTQWRILEKNHNFKIYETWTALREIARQNSPLGILVKETIESGNQVQPKIVEEILAEVLIQNTGKKLILDGFVRNAGNKASADRIVGDYKVLFFNLPEDEAKKRLLGRMYDTETGETFPANTLINPNTGAILTKRADDEESAIEQRIKLFYEVTLPIVEEYKKEWRLIEIDALGSIEEISKRIEKALDL